MVIGKVGVQNYSSPAKALSFKNKEGEKKGECENKDFLMIEEHKKRPLSTSLKIQADKLKKGFTEYPKKGVKGSKNANFYQFLTMGTVPYLLGSATLIGVFNLASKFFSTADAQGASRVGKKLGIGVLAYGVAKTLSKKLIETPVKMKHGIDVNMPYKKVVYELPEEGNKEDLVTSEYHKVFESVDFPRWDLLYDNKNFGDGRNAYYEKVAKKMNMDMSDIEHADQKMKPIIREKVVQTKLFSTISSYLWAATAVGIANQKPFESMVLNPLTRLKNFKDYKQSAKIAKEAGNHIAKYDNIAKDFGKRFVTSFKDFIGVGKNASNVPTAHKVAGRALLGVALGVTLLGNFVTLLNVNKDKGSKAGATSLMDPNREKVVC